MMKIAFTLLCCTALMVFAAHAQTPKQIKGDPANNNAPPPGAILDLNGTPIPGGGNGTTYQQYTVDFTATIASTAITFAFRDDPAFISFTDASVTDLTHPSGNLLLNGNFTGGVYSNNGNASTAVDWTYANMYGATFGGVVSTDCYPAPSGNADCWYDGAVQAYDAISQTIATTVGDTYQISFWLAENSNCGTDTEYELPCNFSDVSTNGDTTDTGGNGIDVTVYAQSGLPPATQQLTLTELASGSGTVTDNMQMIDCTEVDGSVTGTCSASYPYGTVVTLTESPTAPSTFGGWGGACAGSGTNPTCSLTMNSAQNVTASFVVPGQTQSGTATTTATTVLQFQNNAYNYTAQLNTGSSTAITVTSIPMSVTACNDLVQMTYPGAQCFVFTNLSPPPPASPVPDSAVLFELTCPNLLNGQCNPLDAELGTNFNLSTEPGVNTYNPLDPFPGWLKGNGGVPGHPCTPPSPPAPLFQSNQIDFFSLSRIDPGEHGGSGGSGSCWTATYAQPDEVPPSITITSPTNTSYAQGASVPASYTCFNPTSSKLPELPSSGNPVGPYLTTVSCTQATGTQTSCTPLPTSPGGLACTGTVNTSTVGTQAFQVTAMDSGTNTSRQSVSYTVVAPTDLVISNLGAPGTAATGSHVTYTILVGDLGPVNAVEVMVTDLLPSNTKLLSASGSNCVLNKSGLVCTPVICSDTGNIVSCTVGTLAPLSLSSLNGAALQINVQITAEPVTSCKVGSSQKPCTINTATVSAINTDTNSNKSSSAQTIW